MTKIPICVNRRERRHIAASRRLNGQIAQQGRRPRLTCRVSLPDQASFKLRLRIAVTALTVVRSPCLHWLMDSPTAPEIVSS
jgi:hypothetical protein